MEMKEITKKGQLKGTKIRVGSDRENERVQNALFKLGIDWMGQRKQVKYLYGRYLYISYNLRLSYKMEAEENYDFFMNSDFREIYVADLLKPKTLKIINGVEYC